MKPPDKGRYDWEDGDIVVLERESEEKDWDGLFKHSPGGHEHDQQSHGGGGGEGGGDEGADKYGLSAKDRAQVVNWIGSGYRELRTDPNFGKVLEKLPQATGMFFRGTRLTPENAARLKAGLTIRMDKFSSSSDRRSVAEKFMSGQTHHSNKTEKVMFEVRGAGRRLPRQLTQEHGADESEVVLMRGDRFRIDSAVDDEDEEGHKFTRITMSQINA